MEAVGGPCQVERCGTGQETGSHYAILEIDRVSLQALGPLRRKHRRSHLEDGTVECQPEQSSGSACGMKGNYSGRR